MDEGATTQRHDQSVTSWFASRAHRVCAPGCGTNLRLGRFRQSHDHVAERFPQVGCTLNRHRQTEVPLGELDS